MQGKERKTEEGGSRMCIYLIHLDLRVTHGSAFLPVHDNLYIVPQSFKFSIVVHERYKNTIRFPALE